MDIFVDTGRSELVATIALLTGSGDSGRIEPTTLDDFIARDFLCVACCERFDLAAALNRHNDNLDDGLQVAWQNERPVNSKAKSMYEARHLAGLFSKQGMAILLQDYFDTKMKQWQYDTAPDPVR